jgi:LuxR family maltose regulon positive regulatory protein
MKSSALLRTKFLIPRPTTDRLPRPHLVAWFENHLEKRLFLLSAPPGYGKTTLLADILSACPLPAAWVQLDASDSDPSAFLATLIEALGRMRGLKRSHEGIGQMAKSLLESAQPSVSPQQVLTVLINELFDSLPQAWLLILEDYHIIASPVVHQLVDLLLENGPSSLHVLISTRTDPPLALARLRARGLLEELRVPELRFRDDEITALFQRAVPGLSEQSLSLLIEKTEGWAAALQIVRSSLAGQDRGQAEQYIASLSGSQRFIFEYLAEEVFRRQSPERQEFLLYTSILDQVDAPICNTLLGISDAQAVLDQLEQDNLFLASLDPQRHWYRYHPLFREFLASRLQRDRPGKLAALHQAAGQDYERQGEMEAAFLHYVEAADWNAAARAIRSFAADFVERGRAEVLHRYLSALPSEALHANPELLLQHGNVRRRLGEAGMAINDFEDARADFAIQNDPSGVCRALTLLAEVHRAQGNYRQAEALAARALTEAPAQDHAARADALMALAKSVGFLTGMDQGRKLAEQAVEEIRLASDRISAVARANYLQSLGQICWWYGDPQGAVRYCKEALQLIPGRLSPITAQAYICLVSMYLYWHDLDSSLDYAERALEICQAMNLRELYPSAYSALGNVLTRRGEIARSESLLRQAMELAQKLGLAAYERLMTAGYLALNLSGQGRVEEAQQIAESALWAYAGNPDTYEAFVCRSVLADISLEQQRYARAEQQYSELLEVGERRQFRIPLAMVQFGLAYIHIISGRKESGYQFACQALKLIDPTQAIQLFLDQGERCQVVCQALQDAGVENPFVQRVLESLPVATRLSVGISNPTAIQVQCLGAFHVSIDGEEVLQSQWVSTKARDLLAYFITQRRTRVSGERAFDAIWMDKPGRGMTAFHTALSRLRHALRSGETGHAHIHVEAGEYWLDTATFSIDVDEFDAALAKARTASTQEIAAQWYETAIGLYHGEYLENLYYDWILPERQRLSQAYIATLRVLADYHLSRERYTRALELLQRAVRVDNLIEDLHCQMMNVYCSLGDRAGLVHQYQELEATLADELGVLPAASTTRLYRILMESLK